MFRQKCLIILVHVVWVGLQMITGYMGEAEAGGSLPKTADIVSDFLSMNTKEFTEEYDVNELYDGDILYCDKNAWKYHGEVLDPFHESDDYDNYYDVDDITAIRFINTHSLNVDISEETDDLTSYRDVENVFIQYFGDYAVSMYFQEKRNTQDGEEWELMELSYIKVKLSEFDSRKVAPESFYEFLEKNYYEVQEEIQLGEWSASPGGTKEVGISNGSLPKHPSQIFVRYQEKVPNSIYRITWESFFAGWIDEDHFIYYNDFGPFLIHLEKNQIEDIKKEDDDYDSWGCRYEIKGEQLIAIFMKEEYYRWDIIRKDGDIHIIKAENYDD